MSKIISDTIQGRSKDPNVNAGLTIAGVTTATGVINASSDVRITGNLNAGIVTVTSISGNGAGLSNVGVDTATVDVSTLQVSGISTFKNELKVTGGGIEVDAGGLDVAGVGTFAGVVNASSDVRVTGNLNAGITTATAFVPSSGQLSNRNLIINGAMQVAQRGTSSTSSGYKTVDRFSFSYGGNDEAPTIAKASVVAGTTPYTLGFTNSIRVTNGDNTVGAADYIEIYQYIEDQNIITSGWNFKSDTSFITISFWVKSSVSQKFAGFLYTNEAAAGDCYMYSYQIDNGSGGNLTADTWTKITHSIKGNSNLTFNNDTTRGLSVGIFPFNGTDYTTSGHTENTWAAWSSSNKIKDMTSTWYDTNNATFEFTGLQLEVGPVATPFEHRSIGDELIRCQRYFQSYPHDDTTTAEGLRLNGDYSSVFQTPMRDVPTGTVFGTGGTAGSNSGKYDKDAVGNTTAAIETKHSGFEIDTDGGVGLAAVTLDAEI